MVLRYVAGRQMWSISQVTEAVFDFRFLALCSKPADNAVHLFQENNSMMKRFALLGLVITLLLPFDVSAQKGGSRTSSRSSGKSSSKSSSSKSKSSKSPKSSNGNTAHVKEYERKDGTVVRAHDRAAPGTKKVKSSDISSSSRGKSTIAVRDANGQIKRRSSAKKEFMKNRGYPKERKGYVLHHITPLECGGADVPSNMQWQTVQEAKIKDRSERNCRRE